MYVPATHPLAIRLSRQKYTFYYTPWTTAYAIVVYHWPLVVFGNNVCSVIMEFNMFESSIYKMKFKCVGRTACACYGAIF